MGTRISEEVVRDAWNTAVSASPAGTNACVATWHTDFRDDLPKIDIPVLVLHGTADRILPIEACGARTHKLIKGSDFVASTAQATACAGPTPRRSTLTSSRSSADRALPPALTTGNSAVRPGAGDAARPDCLTMQRIVASSEGRS